MIRVNLLGELKPAACGSGFSITALVGRVLAFGSPTMKLLMISCLCGGVNAGYWFQLQHEQKELGLRLQAAQAANQQLAAVKAKYFEREREVASLRQRVQVIEQLRAAQSGPVDLLRTLGDTVNRTEAVWLSSMKDQGATIALEGMALSTDAVANLMMSLKKSGYFRNIEIQETFQDETYKETQAFQFVLSCDKAKT